MAINAYHDGLGSVEFSVIPEDHEIVANGQPESFSFEDKWGLPVNVVYRLGLAFYKENNGKVPLHIPYKDKVRLVAFTKQSTHGSFRPGNENPGFLDVIGNDRRQAWASLGDMSKEDAMIRFVDLLDILCPLFKPYIEAHKRDRQTPEENGRESEELQEKRTIDSTDSSSGGEEGASIALSAEQERCIKDALNMQTLHQFRAFCEQQLPGKPDEQKLLIERLQEEHFQQYMKYWMEFQANGGQQLANGDTSHVVNENPIDHAEGDANGNEVEHEGDVMAQGSGVGANIQAASIWTRKDIKEFKDSVKKEGAEGILKVGQGETVTIRVPTHPEGNYLFWEFATDSYDIGFGLFFEWSQNGNDSRVTIHVSESDEEDEDLDGEGIEGGVNDPEKGPASAAGRNASGVPIDEIVPVYRRDCHEEVVAGSHLYPARQGVYLLKFDNSFSLWRSKTLYYRVYYTR